MIQKRDVLRRVQAAPKLGVKAGYLLQPRITSYCVDYGKGAVADDPSGVVVRSGEVVG